MENILLLIKNISLFQTEEPSKLEVKITNNPTLKAGKSEITWKVAVIKDISTKIEIRDDKIKTKDMFTYWQQIPKNTHWNFTTRKMMKVAELLKMEKFVHIKFIS